MMEINVIKSFVKIATQLGNTLGEAASAVKKFATNSPANQTAGFVSTVKKFNGIGGQKGFINALRASGKV